MASEAASKALIEHLKYSRQRANFLAALGLAALLAWWALPDDPSSAGQLDQAYQEHVLLLESGTSLERVAPEAAVWITNAPLGDLDQHAKAVRDAASSVQGAGAQANESAYFGVSETRDRLAIVQSRLKATPVPRDPARWSRSNLADVGAILAAQLDEPESDEIRTTRQEFAVALRVPEASEAARAGLNALRQFELAQARFHRAARPTDPVLAERLVRAAASLEKLGFERPEALLLAGEARATTRALQQNSLSILGFTIPGLAVRLLLPIVALCLAIDLALATGRAGRFAASALPAARVRSLVQGFPWLFTPTRSAPEGDRGGLRHSLVTVLVPLIVLAAPVLAMLPLVASGSGSTEAAGIFLLVATLCLQAISLSSLIRMAKASHPGEGAYPDFAIWGDLAREHLNGAGRALTLLLILSATVLAFFLALVLAPPRLLEDHSTLSRAAATREAFARAYDQRLLSNEQVFSNWYARASDVWTDFSFARMLAPESHPATSTLEQLSKHPIVSAQMPATAHVHDLVLESRARVDDMDRFDIGHVRELLERSSFEPVVSLLDRLRQLNATQALPADVLERLPQGVTEPASAGASVPFLVPYRTFVERGGFADRLAALPTPEAMNGWFALMEENGIGTVAGFDVFAAAIQGFDAEIGKARLRIAGIEVNRSAARDVALVAILLFTGVLAFRLRQANLFLACEPSQAGPVRAGTPGTLLTSGRALPRATRWGLDLLSCGGGAAAALIVVMAPGVGERSSFPIAVLLSIVFLSILAAYWRRRLVSADAAARLA